MRSETAPVLVDLNPRRVQLLAGAVRGAAAFDDSVAPAMDQLREHQVLVLSFLGAEFVTASFLKAVWMRLHPKDAASVPSMIADASEDVVAEFETLLRAERMAGLQALDWMEVGVTRARLHGHMEDPARVALAALLQQPGATAPDLHSRASDSLSPTAWTNRLNELHRQGLAFREKAGRAWRFFPITGGIENG